MDLLEEYVKRASDPDSQQEADFKTFQGRTILQRQEILNGEAYKLFVDLSSPYPRRLHIVKYFWVLSQEKAGQAHRSVREGIASAFFRDIAFTSFTYGAAVGSHRALPQESQRSLQ